MRWVWAPQGVVDDGSVEIGLVIDRLTFQRFIMLRERQYRQRTPEDLNVPELDEAYKSYIATLRDRKEVIDEGMGRRQEGAD